MYALTEFLQGFSILSVAIRLVFALVIGGIIGLERSSHGRAAGMRTHILVCVGSALASLIGEFALIKGLTSDPLRIGAQVVSGIGFLGAGIILVRHHSRVVGLTTAAGLWNTAVIGLALGLGFFEGALLCFLLALITILVLKKIEQFLGKKDTYSIFFIEVSDMSVNAVLGKIKNNGHVKIRKTEIVSSKSGRRGSVGIYLTLTLEKNESAHSFEDAVIETDGVIFALFLQ